MRLVLGQDSQDAQALLTDLEAHWARGAVVGLARAEEREALRAAVLGTDGEGLDRAQAQPGSAARERRPSARQHPATAGPGVVLGSGGSSGRRRWCLQPLEHLEASAAATGAWLVAQGINPGDCLHLNALPPHHISGLMPLLRARRWRAGLRSLKPALLRHPAQLADACPLPPDRAVLLSLVPTQLHRLLEEPAACNWLRRCRIVWVGGAALPAELAKRARQEELPLAPCYGATETAAMVCALPPDAFLAGVDGCGAPLPDVEIQLLAPDNAVAMRSGRLSPGWFQAGELRPFGGDDGWWRSGDGGRWLADGTATGGASLQILGRLDGAILSGGETVFPEQLEERLRAAAAAAGLPLEALLLVGRPEEPWGERLAALVRPRQQAEGAALLLALQALTANWPAPQQPRHWRLCGDLAPNGQGKWERARWRQWLLTGGVERAPN